MGLCIICIISVLGDFGQAISTRQQTQTQTVEEANHRAEIADLKRLLAEQKLREIAMVGQAQQNHLVQVELSKRTTLEDKRQAEETRHEVGEKATDQRNLIAQKDAENIQRSVRDLQITQKGFQEDAKGFQSTGVAINRSVNRIEKVALTYQIILPLNRPDMAVYREKLMSTILMFQLDTLQGKDKNNPAEVGLTNEGNTYIAANGAHLSSKRIEISPNSPLYPSTFDTSFRELLSYPLFIKIMRGRVTPSMSTQPISDLTVETHPGLVPKVYYFPSDGTLRLAFNGAIGSISKATNNLWSLLDLKNSRVNVMRNTFDYTTSEFAVKPASALQRDCLLTSIVLSVNDSSYAYGVKDFTYHRDNAGMMYCSFVFNPEVGLNGINSVGPSGYF